MCNISEKIRRKTATIYKVVHKAGTLIEPKYYSYFAGVEVKIGVAIDQSEVDYARYIVCRDYNNMWDDLFNSNMKGMISGFVTLNDAKDLLYYGTKKNDCAILKVVIGGLILKGTTDRISNFVRDDGITLAGSLVCSFEEVKL